VTNEVKVETSEVTELDMVAAEVTAEVIAEVVVAETNSISVCNQSNTVVNEYSRGLQGLATTHPMTNKPNATRK
jgi:hypothetical protein